jgi:Tol biopolymer transport system component
MKQLNRWLILLVVVTVASIAPSVLAGAPTGAGPNDPLMVTGTWQALAGNSRVWYYFDYTGDKSRIQVFLDDNAATSVDMGIFTPVQAQGWMSDPTTRTPTPGVTLVNPYATPVPQGTITGRIVFQDGSGGNIYLVNADGSNLKRLTYGLDPAVSPDGKQLAFTRWDQPTGVYVANIDGSNAKEIFSANKALSPQWSPDGTRIAFSRLNGGVQDDKTICFFKDFCYTYMADPHYNIVVLNASTLAQTEPKCSNHCFSPTWSSDNHTLVYADGTFGVLATDSTPNSGPAYNVYTANPNVQSTLYSPDGSRIVFQARGSDKWNINVMNYDGSNVTPVTRPDPLGFTSFNSVAPTWSPDGKQILFLSDRNGKWEFFAANADGTNLRQVLKSLTDTVPITYNFSNERVFDWIP